MFRQSFIAFLFGCVMCSLASAQIGDPAGATRPSQATQPVPALDVPDVGPALASLNEAALATVSDLSKMRIEKWKIDSSVKQQSQQNADSLQRNLTAALPQLTAQVRQSPNSASANFKLYRNLNVVYDVLSSVTESSGAFGTKDEFQNLANDIGQIDRVRRSLADRLEILTAAQDTTIASLRTQIQSQPRQAQQQNTTLPKRIVVDETQPVKKPVVKKKPSAATPAASPATGTQAPK